MEKRYDIDVEREALREDAVSVSADFMKLIDKIEGATEENTPELKYAHAAMRIANKAYGCTNYEEVVKLEEELEKIKDIYDEL